MTKRPSYNPRPLFPRLEANGTLFTILIAIWTLFGSSPIHLDQVKKSLFPPIADLKVNGMDGPVVLTVGEPYTFSWASANATECDIVWPYPSSVELRGKGKVNPGESYYYPTVISPVTLTFECQVDDRIATDSILLQVDSRRLMLARLLLLPGQRI
jgi:hypothetical protein